jgi:pyridoxal phosphate phosphatase PHOSPHO2
VDQDTDRWVFEVLAPHLRRKMKTLKNEVQWTDLVYVLKFTVAAQLNT